MSDERGIAIRNAAAHDYRRVLAVVDDWWGGRDMSRGLSRVFFEHFTTTSFVADDGGRLVAFLTGFFSQAFDREAYVHFVGVSPDRRREGLAATLYQRFFSVAHANGCNVVRATTSPLNRASIAFHLATGFDVEPGDDEFEGVPVRLDYPSPGETRVCFRRRLTLRRVVIEDGLVRGLLAS